MPQKSVCFCQRVLRSPLLFALVVACSVGSRPDNLTSATPGGPSGQQPAGVPTDPGTGQVAAGDEPTTAAPAVASPNAALPVATLEPSAPSNVPVVDANFIADANYPVALVGRFDLRNPNQYRFNLTGTRVGVHFTGTSLAVKLVTTGDDTFALNVDGVEYASSGNAFVVNGNAALTACVPMAQVPAADGNHYPGCVLAVGSRDGNEPTTFPLASGLAEGNHTAWLTKRSEFAQLETDGSVSGTDTLYGFVLDTNASLLPAPSYRARRLEFIGDSSFSGYGADMPYPCAASTRNCDGSRNVPYFTGQYLHAESVNLSSSGQGVYCAFFDQNPNHLLSVLYRQTVGFDASLAYDFSRDHVDAVVLSAGGDDLWGSNGNGYFKNCNAALTSNPCSNFVAAYTNFLAEIRAQRPHATIFAALTHAAYGNDMNTLGSAIAQSVAARNDAGDANVVYYTYFPTGGLAHDANSYANFFDMMTGQHFLYGCDGHTSAKSSQYLGGLLGAFVAQRMGWSDVGY